MTTARHLRAVDGPLRFGVAVRVSQVMGRSGERFHSPETQEAAARAAVARAGGVVDETVGINGVFTDLDVSGKTAPSDRPGMGAALELVRQGRLDGVAVYDVSRWSRDTVSGLRELQEIAAAGGQVISAAETIDVATPSGMFTTTIQLAAAQLRRDEASKAWRATHQSRHDRGLPHGKVPLGYVASGGEVTVDPVLGPVIAQAFQDYAAGTASQITIARRLTEVRGVLTRQGVVSKFLRNPFHAGLLTYNGDTKIGRHEPLVTVETFEQVQARLADDRFAAPRNRSPVSFVAGLVMCARCGRPLHRRGGGYRLSEGQAPARLKCSGTRDGLCVGVGTPRVSDLEEAVLTEVLRLAQEMRDGTPDAMARRSRMAQAGADAARLRAEAKALRESIGRAGALLAVGTFDEIAYDATVAQLRVQLREVESAAARAEAATGTVVPLEMLTSAAERIQQLWPVMTPVEQRGLVCLFVRKVTIKAPAYRGEPVTARLSYEEA
jgi:DNA invertase Pin-like site-specific DNA recombinase